MDRKITFDFTALWKGALGFFWANSFFPIYNHPNKYVHHKKIFQGHTDISTNWNDIFENTMKTDQT
jgi:hypothetical protein